LYPFADGYGGIEGTEVQGENLIPGLNFEAVVADVSGALTELTHVRLNGGHFLLAN